MGKKAALVFLMCFLANSWASPIDSSKEEAVQTQDGVVPTAEIQDKDVKEILTVPEKLYNEEPAKDETKTDVKPENVTPQEASERHSREGKSLGAENQDNVIGGTSHRLNAETEDALLQKLNKKCSQRDVSSCVMLKLVTYMNRLLKKSNIEVFEGLHITQTASEEQVAEETQPLDNPRSAVEEDDESQLSQLTANKLWTFVRTRSLRWSVLPDADVVMSTSPDEEGALNVGMSIRTGKALEKGRGKMKQQMGSLMAAAAMKFALLGGLAFKGLVLLVGKALLVSKIALLLAGILWLKKLFSHQKHVTYEVVAHPHQSHSSVDHHGGDSYSSGWGRSSEPHQLAYSGYAPIVKTQ